MSGFYWLGSAMLVEGPRDILAPAISFSEAYEVTWEHALASGLRVISHRGGLVLIDFSALPNSMSVSIEAKTFTDESFVQAVDSILLRTKVMNAWILCVQSAVVELHDHVRETFRVSHRDLVHTNNVNESVGGAQSPVGIVPGLGFANTFISRHWAIPAETLVRACELLDAIMAAGSQALDLIDLISLATESLGDHNYALGVTTAWTASETMIQIIYKEYLRRPPLRPDGPPVTGKRRDILEGRDYSASIVIEMLALGGVLSDAEYNGITKARRARNNWIHDMKPTDMGTGKGALDVALGLFERNIGVKLLVIPYMPVVM